MAIAEKAEKKQEKPKKQRTGRVDQIIGPVVDVVFEGQDLPEIYHALEIDRGKQGRLVLEVQQHRGNDVVRTIAKDSTAGLVRGTEVKDTGGPITVPVGKATLGQMMNVIGEPIDGKGKIESGARLAVPRPAARQGAPRQDDDRQRRADRRQGQDRVGGPPPDPPSGAAGQRAGDGYRG